MSGRKTFWFVAGCVVVLAVVGASRDDRPAQPKVTPEMANARLDAEIKRSLRETGSYVVRTVDYKARALTLCSRYAKAAATHPSTVSFGWGSKVDVHADNSADVTAKFRAKNSFGLELEHHIACRVSPAGDVTAQIAEAG